MKKSVVSLIDGLNLKKKSIYDLWFSFWKVVFIKEVLNSKASPRQQHFCNQIYKWHQTIFFENSVARADMCRY